jgi:hypothetical protein
MKAIICCIILLFCIVTSGCVRRTVTETKGSPSPDGSRVANPTSKVVEEKTIWFWQDGFRQP